MNGFVIQWLAIIKKNCPKTSKLFDPYRLKKRWWKLPSGPRSTWNARAGGSSSKSGKSG